MAEFATEEWAAEAGALWSRLPPAGTSSGVVSMAVAVAPRREVAWHWVYQDGSVVGGGAGLAGLGAPEGSGPGSQLALTLGVADAAEVLNGAVAPSVAFMRGRLKAVGDGELLLAFLASTEDTGWKEWCSHVSALSGG